MIRFAFTHPALHPAHPAARCHPMAGRGGPGPRRHGGHGPGRRGPGGPLGGFGPDPGLRAFGPRGPRAGRGDVRAGLLLLLLEEPMHGYQLIAELQERSGGAWRPSPGSVYPTLKRLAAEGLLAGADTEGRGRRRAFALTDEGRAEAQRLAEAGTAPWDEVSAEEDEGAVELRDLVHSLVEAARQVGRVADARQAEEARGVLADARRRLYGILAAEPSAAPEATGEEDRPAS